MNNFVGRLWNSGPRGKTLVTAGFLLGICMLCWIAAIASPTRSTPTQTAAKSAAPVQATTAPVVATVAPTAQAPAQPTPNVQATVDAAVKATQEARPTEAPTAPPAPSDTPAPPTEAPPTSPPPPTATPAPQGPQTKTSGCKVDDICSGSGMFLRIAERTNRVARINQFLNPAQGNNYLVMTVAIENARKDPIPYNPLYFKLRDSNGFEYATTLLAPEPSLKTGTLAPGDFVSGNLAFEVPQTAGGLVLSYQPLVIGGNYQPIRIEIDK